MGNISTIFDCCYKKKEIKKPLIIPDNDRPIRLSNNRLTRLSDIIENKTVEWESGESKEGYYNLLNDANELKNKLHR